MFLTLSQIKAEREKGTLDIQPWNEDQLNPNSYNVCLGEELLVYKAQRQPRWKQWVAKMSGYRLFSEVVLSLEETNAVDRIRIPEEGFVLEPGILYLGRTVERTTCHKHVPLYEGRSSTARLGLESHVCGGWGDVGFDGTWTLEIRATHPIRVYKGMQIGQVGFANVEGEITPYGDPQFKSRYQGQVDVTPSRIHWKDW